MAYMTGEATAATGKPVAEIDQAAASGVIPAKYEGWMLLVDVTPPTKKAKPTKAATKRTAAKRGAKKR